MIRTQSLDSEEARQVGEAVLKVAAETMPPEGPVTVAVVDPNGDLLYFVRMDGMNGSHSMVALNKAYTAARLRRDSSGLQDMVKQGMDIHWLGDTRYAAIPGGVVIRANDGSVLGAIGVTGRRPLGPMGDEELARIGAKAVQV
jgi:glc operon protein GlcG